MFLWTAKISPYSTATREKANKKTGGRAQLKALTWTSPESHWKGVVFSEWDLPHWQAQANEHRGTEGRDPDLLEEAYSWGVQYVCRSFANGLRLKLFKNRVHLHGKTHFCYMYCMVFLKALLFIPHWSFTLLKSMAASLHDIKGYGRACLCAAIFQTNSVVNYSFWNLKWNPVVHAAAHMQPSSIPLDSYRKSTFNRTWICEIIPMLKVSRKRK